jgi:hypothetical protein
MPSPFFQGMRRRAIAVVVLSVLLGGCRTSPTVTQSPEPTKPRRSAATGAPTKPRSSVEQQLSSPRSTRTPSTTHYEVWKQGANDSQRLEGLEAVYQQFKARGPSVETVRLDISGYQIDVYVVEGEDPTDGRILGHVGRPIAEEGPTTVRFSPAVRVESGRVYYLAIRSEDGVGFSSSLSLFDVYPALLTWCETAEPEAGCDPTVPVNGDLNARIQGPAGT